MRFVPAVPSKLGGSKEVCLGYESLEGDRSLGMKLFAMILDHAVRKRGRTREQFLESFALRSYFSLMKPIYLLLHTLTPLSLTKHSVYISMPSCLRHTLDIVACILINLIIFRRPQDDLVRLQPVCLLNDFPGYEDNWKQEDHEIGEQERGNIPLSFLELVHRPELRGEVRVPGKNTVYPPTNVMMKHAVNA